MNNFDVARAFVRGSRATGSNFTTDGTTLYSYNTAIAKRMKDGSIVVNKTKYSRTTNKQLGYLYRSIPENVKVTEVDNKGYNYEFEDVNDFTQDNDDVMRKHLRR